MEYPYGKAHLEVCILCPNNASFMTKLAIFFISIINKTTTIMAISNTPGYPKSQRYGLSLKMRGGFC